MSELRNLGDGIGRDFKFPIPSERSPYDSDEVPELPEEIQKATTPREQEEQDEPLVSFDEIEKNENQRRRAKEIVGKTGDISSLQEATSLDTVGKAELKRAALRGISGKPIELSENDLFDVEEIQPASPPPIPKEARYQSIARDMEEEKDLGDEALDKYKKRVPLARATSDFDALPPSYKLPESPSLNELNEQEYQLDKSFPSLSKGDVAQMLESLGSEFEIVINPDGSIPRGGILGRNKRQFEKLSKNNPEFLKRYNNLFMEYQKAEKQAQPLMKKQPSRAAAGLLAAGLASGAMGSTLQRRAEEDRQGQKIEKSLNTQNKKELTDMASTVKAQKEIGTKIPFDTSTEYTTLPETKTGLRSVEIKPGEKIDRSLLSKLEKMKPGTRKVESLGPNTTVELIKNPRGENFVLVKFQGERTRGVSVDGDGIAHKASDVQMFGADMNFSNGEEKTPAFKIETSEPKGEKPERKIQKIEKKELGKIQEKEITPQRPDDDEIQDEGETGSLLALDQRKPSVDLGRFTYDQEKGPVKLRTVGKRDTLYNALVRDFAARQGINVVSNRKEAVELVDSWIQQMENKKLKATFGGQEENIQGNLKELLQRPGQGEIEITVQ